MISLCCRVMYRPGNTTSVYNLGGKGYSSYYRLREGYFLSFFFAPQTEKLLKYYPGVMRQRLERRAPLDTDRMPIQTLSTKYLLWYRDENISGLDERFCEISVFFFHLRLDFECKKKKEKLILKFIATKQTQFLPNFVSLCLITLYKALSSSILYKTYRFISYCCMTFRNPHNNS